MKYLIRLILPIYVIFLVASEFSEGQEAKELEIPIAPGEVRLDIKMARDIVNRRLVDVDSVFENTVDRVWCWSRVIRSTSDIDTIYHVWNYEGNEESRVPLIITSPNFRAFTFQTIKPEQTGDWTVYIIDKENNILGKIKFRIVPSQPSEVASKLP